MQSQSVIYHAQIVHAYQRRISEELCGRFLLMLLLLLSYEQKITLEIFEAVLATTVSTTEDSAQLIFQLQIMSTFVPLGLLPSRVSLDDVIPPKMSYNPFQKFRPYTGIEIRPNRDFNG